MCSASNFLPSLIIDPGDPIFIGAIFGFILAVPVALFLAYWISDVKKKIAVVIGSFVGLIGVLSWVDTLVFSTPLPKADGVSTFFSTILLCSVLGLIGAMLTDLLIARRTAHDCRWEV